MENMSEEIKLNEMISEIKSKLIELDPKYIYDRTHKVINACIEIIIYRYIGHPVTRKNRLAFREYLSSKQAKEDLKNSKPIPKFKLFYTHKEIADKYGCSLASITKNLYKMIDLLKRTKEYAPYLEEVI